MRPTLLLNIQLKSVGTLSEMFEAAMLMDGAPQIGVV